MMIPSDHLDLKHVGKLRRIVRLVGDIVNVHQPTLPRRCPYPMCWTLAESDDDTGLSLHRIKDESIGAGLLLAERVRPDGMPPAAKLAHNLVEAEVPLLVATVKAFLKGGREQADMTTYRSR
jgi:methionyl-tRNA formyltransferase